MSLSAGLIVGIVLISILLIILIAGITYYVITTTCVKDGTCDKIMGKFTARSKGGDQRSEMVANYPEVSTSFIRTPVAGQQFTSRELEGVGGTAFVVPSKEVDDIQKYSMYSPIDPSGIDPRLYTAGFDAEGVASSSTGGKRPPQVIFTVQYDQQLSILNICILEARHLRPGSHGGTCDPYCTVAVTPGTHGEKKSKVQRKTFDPIFNENFGFEVPKNVLMEKTIEIKFYDYDQFSRHECTGTVLQKIKEIKLGDGKVDLWRKITLTRPDSAEQPQEHGDLLLRLGYLPSAEKLTVVLLKARNLKSIGEDEVGKQPDPYVRVAILHDGGLLKKKKTSTKRRTSNPTYNQAINFAVPLDVLPRVEIQFSVVHDSGARIHRTAQKETIGFLEIGPHSTAEEYEHWVDLMSNKPQARWHRLRKPPDVKDDPTNTESEKSSTL